MNVQLSAPRWGLVDTGRREPKLPASGGARQQGLETTLARPTTQQHWGSGAAFFRAQQARCICLAHIPAGKVTLQPRASCRVALRQRTGMDQLIVFPFRNQGSAIGVGEDA